MILPLQHDRLGTQKALLPLTNQWVPSVGLNYGNLPA